MSQEAEFPFSRARRVTSGENQQFRQALSDQFDLKLRKRGRPAKDDDEKYEPISIRLHPKAIAWAKDEAQKRGLGYQTVINEILLAQVEDS